MIDPKVFMTSNMITYTYFFLLIFEFKPYFTDKYLINNIINQVIGQFYFESKPNNTTLVLRAVNLRIIVQIFYDLKDQFITKNF